MMIVCLSLSAPRAQAISTSSSTTLVALAVTAIAIYLVGSSPPSIEASSKNKKMARGMIVEDAAAYVMNEGKVSPSDLLRSMMDQMRDTPEFRSIDEEIKDMDLVEAILAQLDSELD